MLNIALIRNPIQPDRREEHNAELVPGQNLQECMDPIIADWPETEFVVSVNGNVIEKDDVPFFYPVDGDYIILMPVIGKNFGDILKSVLTLALAAWVGPIMAANYSGLMAGIYTATITMIGGAVLNAIIPTSQENASINYDPTEVGVSSSYGWNGSTVTEVPGTAVGRIYGTVSPTLVRLQRHISTDGSNQYLNYLFSCGMGPADSIQDMKVAGNPIANYDDVEYWTRLGTNNQDTIANFSTNYDDYPLSYELENDSAWHTKRTEGNAVAGLEVMVELPSGLYYTNDDASLGSASVGIECQYKLAADTTWTDFMAATTISGADNAAIFKTFRVDNITSGQYDVRMRCTSKSGTTTRYSTRIYWIQLSEISYADFCYPNLILWGVKIKATSQLSGSDPEFKCTVTKSKVWIWNPYTLAYEQKRATNPYWAGYDFLHHCEYLMNIQTGVSEFYVEGIAARRFDYDQIKRCADYSDGILASGAYRFELNLFVEGSITVKEALNQIAMVGRGVFLPRGTKFSCICDMPMEMTTVFGDGRIITGSMNGEWQGVENRSRSVEVTFWNKENNLKKDMAPYQSPSYNEDGMIPNPTQLTYKGITDYEHAYLEAAFNGRCNEYKKRTKVWQSDINAIGCMIGDVVGVQSKTSRWGVGGRIVSATANTITLDQTVTLVAGTIYKTYLTLADDTTVQRTIATVTEDTETNVLTLTEAFDVVPEQFDLYVFGTTLALMRILSIVKANDLKAKITAEQYFAEIYDDNIDIPERSYSDFTVKALTVKVAETWPRPADGTANLSVSFIWPRDGRIAQAVILAGRSSDTLQTVLTVSLGSLGGKIINVNATGTWYMRVNITDVFGAAIATGDVLHVIAAEALGSVTNLTSYYQDSKVWLKCDKITDYRAIDYEWRMGSDSKSATVLGRTTDPVLLTTGDGTYWVAAHTGNLYSSSWESVSVVGSSLPANVIATYDESDTGWTGTIGGGAAIVEYAGDDVIGLIGSGLFSAIAKFSDITSLLYYGDIAASGTYEIPSGHIVDIGAAQYCTVSLTYDARISSPFDLFSKIFLFSAIKSLVGNYSAFGSVTPQIAIAGNDGIFGDWQNYIPGTYYGRKFKTRVLLTSVDKTVSVYLLGLTFAIDVPDRIDADTGIPVPISGFTITHAKSFNALPNTQITLIDAQAGDTLVFTWEDKAGFTVYVKNSGAYVQRTINWLRKGY